MFNFRVGLERRVPRDIGRGSSEHEVADVRVRNEDCEMCNVRDGSDQRLGRLWVHEVLVLDVDEAPGGRDSAKKHRTDRCFPNFAKS